VKVKARPRIPIQVEFCHILLRASPQMHSEQYRLTCDRSGDKVQKPTNTALGIVAQIMIAAGVALLFVVNLQMSRRFYGQLHPHHAVPVQRFITGCIIAVVPVLAAVITTVVQSYTTKNAHVLSVGRTIRLVVSCIFTILPFIPIVIVSLVLILKATSPGGLSAPQILSEDLELAAQSTAEQSARPSSERPVTGDNATAVGNDSASAL
ncbi:10291_t:CDS:2, partial [Acaulospora colombiana]